MKRFKPQKNLKIKIDIIILFISAITIIMLHYYNRAISPKIFDISASKLSEITTLYIKKDIMPDNIDTKKLITVNINKNEEIIDLDINMDYANYIMKNIVEKIQDNIIKLESGNIKDFKNHRELNSYNGTLFIQVPLGLSHDGLLFSNLGPKIPVKLSFYEHVLGTVDVEAKDYGINNALLKVYMTITLEQKLIIPYKETKIKEDYSLLLGSRIITGKVPAIYGNSLKKNSSIITED